MLRKLLDSLARQELSPGLRFRVIVVDNDDERSAEPVVAVLRESGLELLYDAEPIQNISLARNRGFSHVSADADFIATIDDDAQASPRWLATLVETAQAYQADVVFGAVRRVLPSETPPQIAGSGVFDLYNPPTGSTEWLVFNTANSLLRRRAATHRPVPFRPDYGRTGGEDTELFHSLQQAGFKIVWCREAQVDESVSPDRVNLRWILRRSFREGVTYYKVYRRWILSARTPFPLRWLSFAWWLLRAAARITVLSIRGLGSLEARSGAVAALKAAAFHCGIAARTLGVRYEPHHN